MQILNLDTVRLNEAVEELSKIEAELFDLRQQERAAKDVLTRTDITAPVDGIVMDLKVHTTGGVVKPGETLMTVVPLGEQLVVEAMVKPEDIETIAPGQTARVSFPAFARYNLPPLDGVVETVSADRLDGGTHRRTVLRRDRADRQGRTGQAGRPQAAARHDERGHDPDGQPHSAGLPRRADHAELPPLAAGEVNTGHVNMLAVTTRNVYGDFGGLQSISQF